MFGLFTIEEGREPVALLGREGKPCVFETGAEAAQAAARCAVGDYAGNRWETIKVQPRRLASDAWKARELGRFSDGTYVALPWLELPALSLTAEHYAHVSTEDGAKIAYTQDAAKGAGDRQTRVRPGKYLAQFYGEVFDAPTIARMAAEFSLQYGEANILLFADTADDIERVYENGPRSCMAHSSSHFDSSVHPCRIYAAGDLAVAYMERNGEITARALVWPAKKLHGSVYGDKTRLNDLLESAGFVQGLLDGARMLRIEEDKGFVCPYIDDSQSASDAGDYLILGGSGVCGSNQNGLSGFSIFCSDCGDRIAEDDWQSDDNGNCYCSHCYDEAFGYCEHMHASCPSAGMQEVIVRRSNGRLSRQMWSEHAIDSSAFTCAGSGGLYHTDLLVELSDGTQWSQAYFDDNGFVCDGNSEAYSTDDMVTLADGTNWSKDYFRDNGVTVDGEHYAKGDEPQEDAEEPSTPVAIVKAFKAYRPSPTVGCVAQIEMPLHRPLRIEEREGLFCVMCGEDIISPWRSLPYAEEDLAVARELLVCLRAAERLTNVDTSCLECAA